MPVQTQVINLKEVSDYIKSFPAETFKDFKREVAISLFDADANIKSNSQLARRTGALMKSMKVTNQGSGFANYQAGISTDMVYAPIQEKGGIVKAKKAYRTLPGGPYLNIPAKANKTPAGVMRMGAKEVFARGGYIIQYKPFKFGVFLNGRLMFTLHKKVTIPPRLNMVKSVEDTVPGLLSRLKDTIGE